VGSGAPPGDADHAVLWNGTAASAVDLNPTGVTTGVAYGTDGLHQVGMLFRAGTPSRFHATLWSGTAASAIDLNPVGFQTSAAVGVSGTQQVGNGIPNGLGVNHALLWNGAADTSVDLNPTVPLDGVTIINSWAIGTNGAEQVGVGSDNGIGRYHALLWTGTAASAVNLQSFLPSSYSGSFAYSIDAAGNIFGAALDGNGKAQAIEWQFSTPEPASMALLAVGLPFLLPRRRKVSSRRVR
jgi:hypothetical protein